MQAGDAAEVASLMRWLGYYASDVQEGCLTIVLRLLKLAFPDAEALDGWKAVLEMLESFYDTSLVVDVEILQRVGAELNGTQRTVLELVLAALVQCEAKETFVKDILRLEDTVQADLMAIIERVMSRGAAAGQDAAEGVEAAGKPQEDKQEPGLGSPLYLSRNAAFERMKRENGVLKEESIHLARKLENAITECQGVIAEKERLVEMIKQLKEQVDADALRKERSMHALYDERIQTLQLELDSTNAELQEKAALASKVPALRDEVDLLRPLAEKMAKMDTTVAKYKAKIDELSGAKDRLRRLEGTNAELVEKNLALERELAKAASWQRKLMEAKEANTTVEFRVSELETLLTRERQEVASARADLEAAEGALRDAKTLNNELQESASHQLVMEATENNTSCSGPTVAGGISEFNPELMQKLTRLEYENGELKKQVDGETAARIDSLLDEIDDLTRLKKSFEKKFFATQEILQSTQSELECARNHFESSVAGLQERIRNLTERQSCLEEDVSSHSREKAALSVDQNRLEHELCYSTEREQQLTQALSSRESELAELQGANEALTCRSAWLLEQCECLSMSKEDLEVKLAADKQAFEAKLARQIECAAMQMEDADAERLRYHQQKNRELNEVCLQREVESARLALLVDSKIGEINELTSIVQAAKVEHDAERQKLEAAHASMTKELERYQELHSVSNADWSTKEDELKYRVTDLETQRHRLKSTIKSQLESNARLVQKIKGLKVDVAEKRETISTLEGANTRLESRVALLQKERTHFSTQEQRKQDVDNRMSSYSSQLSTQVSLVAAELEKVLKENNELHMKLVGCRCGRESPPRSRTSDSGQKAKNYYLSRIQQLEHDKQHVEHKRRELLLVNAKLIQEQKQLHVKNVSLSNEVHDLEESVNHWRLRDERRRKKEGQPSLPLGNKHSFALPRIKRVPASATNDSTRSERSATQEPRMEDITESTGQNASRGSSVSAFTSAPTNEVAWSSQQDGTHSSNKLTPTPVGSRKRKLDEGYMTPETARPASTEADSAAHSAFTDAKEFFSKPSAAPAQPGTKPSSEPRPKRRLSHFITRPDKNKQQTEKPSECKQQ